MFTCNKGVMIVTCTTIGKSDFAYQSCTQKEEKTNFSGIFFLLVFQLWAKCTASREQCTTSCFLLTSSKSDVATKYLPRESGLYNWWRYWNWQRDDNSFLQFRCQVCYSKPVNINEDIL